MKQAGTESSKLKKEHILDSDAYNDEGNTADFYVDDADLLESDAEGDALEAEKNGDSLSNSLDGSDLDFDEVDYADSAEEDGSGDELKKKAKIVSKEQLAKLLKNCLTGNNYYITKIIQLFNKINSNKVETMDEEHVLNIPKYTNKLIKFYIKDLPDILTMKLNSANLIDNNNKNLSNVFKANNEFALEGDKEDNEDEDAQQSGAVGASNAKQLVRRYLSVLSKYIKNAGISQRSFLFKNLSNCADLVILFSNYTEMYLKFFIKAWVTESGSDASFTCLQTVKRILSKKPQMFEIILKLMYINYLEFAKANSWKTLKRIKEMQEDILSILSYDLQKAYMTIFTFIRKLCIQLRLTINEKRSSSIKSIYNWQFVNSLILWTQAVCKYAKEPFSDIKLLAYPLIQTIIGVIRLNLVDVFFPLRITLVNLLNKISLDTEIFIPCENYLLEILESSNFSRAFKNKILTEADNDAADNAATDNHGNLDENKKKTNNKIKNRKNKNRKSDENNSNVRKSKAHYHEKFDLNINLKVRKESFGNYGNVIYLLDETLDSLIEFCGVNCFKISFPELGLIVINYLRKIAKNMMVF